jgi:hypothetical protein
VMFRCPDQRRMRVFLPQVASVLDADVAGVADHILNTLIRHLMALLSGPCRELGRRHPLRSALEQPLDNRSLIRIDHEPSVLILDVAERDRSSDRDAAL